MSRVRFTFAVLAVLACGPVAAAQVKEPKRPDKLDVEIRYRIRADRDERIRQFRELEKHLAALGFVDARKDDPDRLLDILDPRAERFVGTIPSQNVLRLLDDPRVLNILFAPAGHKYPDTGDQPVAIRIIIRGGLLPLEQQSLHAQVLAVLNQLGFRVALGYDTLGYTQLKGTIPSKHLPLLLKDLRSEPSGWFLPQTTPDRLPRPLADRSPIRWVEVMDLTDPPPAYEPPPVLPIQAKLTPGLRAVLLDPVAREAPLRVNVYFAESVEDRIEQLRTRLVANYGSSPRRDASGKPMVGPDGAPVMADEAAFEAAFGNVVNIRFGRAADAERFAEEPGVLTVSLLPQASETILPLPATVKALTADELLQSSGVAGMHRLGYAGARVKVIVIGTDFTGAEKLPGVRILDLTTELNPDIRPLPADPSRIGTSAAAARAVALSAPEAELVLVRIDPGSLFQLFEVIRLARAEMTYTEPLRSRLAELTARSNEIRRVKEAAVAEYRAAFSDLADDQAIQSRRERAKKVLDRVIAEQAELARRIERFNSFLKDLSTVLTGAQVIVNTLVWDSGYPLDALSSISQYLERLANPVPQRISRRPGDLAAAVKPPLVWVQAASMAGPAVWGGRFLDSNRDGTMEFAPPGQSLPPGNWSPDMNFLGFRSPTGETALNIPAGVKLRITIQWREPKDPNLPALDIPAVPVVLRVFRQLDPEGEKRPSDEMAEVARSAGGPYPILRSPSFVVFEQILELTTPTAGRYALVVATAYQPDPLLPALRREVEIMPRIVIDTLSAKPGEATVVFRSYVTPDAGVGIPGDSLGAVTVGIGGKGELTSGGTGLSLRAKPDLLGPAAIAVIDPAMYGTGVAAGFVAGMATDLVQAGAAGANPFQSSGFAPGKAAVVPEAWMRDLRPRQRSPR